MIDPLFKCFRIPEQGVPVSDKDMADLDVMVEWLHQPYHTDEWDGDDCGITLYLSDIVTTCEPGDWITSIPKPDRSGERRFVRLPRKARKMRMVQLPDDTEKELWCWELPNGQCVYLAEGRDPVLAYLSVDKPSNRGIWIPGMEEFRK